MSLRWQKLNLETAKQVRRTIKVATLLWSLVGKLFDCFGGSWLCSCENRGAGGRPVGDRWARDTSTKKDGRKKNGRKKQTILHQFFSSTTRQSTINQQSVRYLISQVKWIMQMWMILELEVRHPGEKSLWKSHFSWKIKERCQISGY